MEGILPGIIIERSVYYCGYGATFEFSPMSSTFLPLPLLNLSPGVGNGLHFEK